MFRHILVPVDFTKKNAKALEMAARLAEGTKARVTLLHVIERIERIPPDELETFYETLEGRAAARMGPLAARLSQRHPVRGEILLGNRRQEILRYAVRHKVDLIVLSSHALGARGAGGRSISHDLALVAPCAVLLVRQGERSSPVAAAVRRAGRPKGKLAAR